MLRTPVHRGLHRQARAKARCISGAVLLSAIAAPLWAQQSRTAVSIRSEADSATTSAARDALGVTARWNPDGYLSSRARLTFDLTRPIEATHERFGLVVGHTDVSALLEVQGRSVSFTPERLRLPAGESEAVAFVIDSAGDWHELARFPLRIRSRAGLDKATMRPSIELSTSGPVARGDPPDVGPIDRRTYQDVTLRLGVENLLARDGWQLTTQANALGVSEASQRLRFGELQQDAPALDLSDYRVHAERPGVGFVLGHQSVGQHRLLTNGFGSRGIGGSVKLGPAVSLDASLLNGTSVTGWTNPIGINEPQHRVATVGVSLEAIPSRPGALQLHLAGTDGSLLPLTSFTQGAATDAETSRGGAARVVLSDVDQRVRFEGGLARSYFTNPVDPLLTAHNDVVAVRGESRTARYGELSADVLRDMKLFDRFAATLNMIARHERADPLYRSIGAFVQPDRDANGVDVNGTLGLLNVTSGFSSSRDNLQRITSILTSRTRGQRTASALPLASLCKGTWCALPNISYSRDHSHQFGEDVPVNGAFDPSHIPDQVSVNQTATLSWSVRGLATEYRWNHSHQDNRQPGRELADFGTIVHALTVAGASLAGIEASLDLSRELQTNMEIDATQRLDRIGTTMRWQPLRATDVMAVISHAWGSQPADAQRTRNVEYQFELSRGVDLYRRFDGGTQGRVFLRFARTRAAVLPALPQSLLNARITWTLNVGGSIRLF